MSNTQMQTQDRGERAINRSIYTGTPFRTYEFTDLIQTRPRLPTLFTGLDLFTDNFHATTLISVERLDGISAVMESNQRAGDRGKINTPKPRAVPFAIPFFTLDRPLKAVDIQDFRSFGSPNNARAEELVNRIMDDIVRAHAKTREKAMAEALMGRSFNGILSDEPVYDYYATWGVTQKEVQIILTDMGTDPSIIIEDQARAHIIDTKGNDTTVTRVLALCSRKFFNGLIQNPFIREAYLRYPLENNILRNRLNGNIDARVFEHQNVMYIEDIDGLIPEGEAYVFPLGIESMFNMHYAPADHLDYVNTRAQQSYMWYREINDGRSAVIESETSFLAANTRPELVVKLVGVFA